jgi:hypothetical protein
MKPIDNLGLINTLDVINLLINNLGLEHLKVPILIQPIEFRVSYLHFNNPKIEV